MINFKNLKFILVTSVLTIGISLITSQSLFAATLTRNYTVKSGDCLSVIAQTHRESLNNLREANNKWNDLIFPGQALYVDLTTNSTVPKPKSSVTVRPIVQQTKVTAMGYTASDLNLLARLITAEAGGESYKGQVAVGAVVLNRVKSSSFPNSISAVINQKISGYYQFTPVQSGSINKPAQASDIKAAYAALSGIDPTNNALFFYSGSTPKNLTLPQPVAIIIGNQTFVHLL
jgi:hypothetical protein